LESEWFKIKYNRENNREYPRYLIWGLVDDFKNPTKFTDFKIVDIYKLYHDYEKKIYRILPEDKNDLPPSNPNSFDRDFIVLTKIENTDKSSVFLVLDEVPPLYTLI